MNLLVGFTIVAHNAQKLYVNKMIVSTALIMEKTCFCSCKYFLQNFGTKSLFIAANFLISKKCTLMIILPVSTV